MPSRKKENLAKESSYHPIVFGATHIGKIRTGNEDSYRVLVGKDAPTEINALMVVADGMGGHASGEVASAMTVDGLTSRLTRHPLESPMTGEDYSHILGQTLNEVNHEVYLAGRNPEHQGMGTTCTAAALKGYQLYIAHVWDSRGYILRSGKLVQITRDHSWVAEQVEADNLTPEEAEVHPYRNVVTRAIGPNQDVQVDTFVKSVSPGDRVLLCSDGLQSVVDDGEIEATLKTGDVESVCEALIALANANGGPDNITVVVADIGGPEQSTPNGSVDSNDAEIQSGQQPWPGGLLGRAIARLFK